MMAPREMRRLIEEMYASHSILWTLGFTPDELYVSTPNVLNAPKPGLYATLYVRRDGAQFTYWIAPRLEEGEAEQFLTGWQAFIERARQIPRADLDALVKRSEVWRQKASLMEALLLKGFRFLAVES